MSTMSTTTTPLTSTPAATVQQQPEAALIFGSIYSVGIAAALMFVKNPAHQATAANIIQLLNAELPNFAKFI